MDDKFTKEELVMLLAQRHQMEEADAEAFVEAFFALIKETLATDKYVKIKGLGTFKLIDSDDGNAGRSCLSFMPDVSMRELVNKPFSHFETVLLNESAHFDDMIEEEEKAIASEEAQMEIPASDEREPAAFEPEVHPEPLQQTEGMKPETEEEKYEPVPLFPENHFDVEKQKQKPRLPWCFIASVLLIGVIIGGIMGWVLFSGRRYIPDSVVKVLSETRQEPKGTVVSEQAMTVDSLPASKHRETVGLPSSPLCLPDTVRYDIVGTLATHTLRRGESLARLALRYYGNKNLWTYLARYNREILKDVNDIPVGTSIRVPKLVPKR